MLPLPDDEPRFIPLTSDYGFKVTFGNEANNVFLRRALQALIQSETTIEQVTFLPNELSRLSKDGRSGIYDLACQDAAGNFFITVELSKFTKPLAAVVSDLDKLLYTMKTLHTLTDPADYPQFWTEEWLQLAIDELDKRAMTPEELLQYEMTLSANALVLKNERKKLEAITTKAVRRALAAGKLTVEEIADYNDVPVELVLDVRRQMQ